MVKDDFQPSITQCELCLKVEVGKRCKIMIQHVIKKLLREQKNVGFILILGCCLISETDADCETPPTFFNAYVQWELSSAVESSVIYSCNDGYKMSGPADHVVLTCNQEEEWTGPDIDCTESKKVTFVKLTIGLTDAKYSRT